MSKNPTQKLGTITKEGSQFLKTLMDETDINKHPEHPRHHGIKMQAHHAISEKGVELSEKGDELVKFGYDINVKENLVFLPWTLQGACLLQVQPHRGDHTAVKSRDNDADIDHEPSYHIMVRRRLMVLVRQLEHRCGEPDAKIEDETQKKLDDFSAKIIKNIQDDPKLAKLTSVWNHYQPGDLRGCKGVDSIRAAKRDIELYCPVGRNHTSSGKRETKNMEDVIKGERKKQEPEDITYILKHPYRLRPGY
jgi:hypothetical protein